MGGLLCFKTTLAKVSPTFNTRLAGELTRLQG